MTKHLRVITWARWRFHDVYEPKYFTVFTASILRPSFEFPAPCVTMSVHNAAGKVFMRFMSLADLQMIFVVPTEYVERLVGGYECARVEADNIQKQLKAMMHISSLSPGAQLVRTDTGEIVAEADRIARGLDKEGA